MEATEHVLKAMKKAARPLSAGELEKLTGLPRKDVDKAMKSLKEAGSIVSPKRCYWQAK